MRSGRLAIGVALAGAAAVFAQGPSLDYTQWRGEDRAGSASGFVAPKSWPATLSRKWSVDIGEGYSTPLVVRDTVYAFTRRDGNEVLTARRAETGAEIWHTSYAAPYTVADPAARHGAGPKATPLFYRGHIFTMGISGIVSAFDARTGTRVWQTPAPTEAAEYGAASSPLGENGLVILHPGNYGPLTAFDAATGTVKWTAGDDGLFASPIVAVLDGTRQILTVTHSSLIGVSPQGDLLWRYPFQNNGAGTPLVHAGLVIVGGLDLGFVAIRPARIEGRWKAEKVWDTKAVSTYFGTPVVIGDALYGLSDKASGQFFGIDAASGDTLWLGAPRQAGYAAMVKSADLMFALKDDGELIVARADRAAFQVLKTYTVASSPTWAQPAISGDRIFVKDVRSLTLWKFE